MESAEWPCSRIWKECPLSIKSLKVGCSCFATWHRAALFAGKRGGWKCFPPGLIEPWHLTPKQSRQPILVRQPCHTVWVGDTIQSRRVMLGRTAQLRVTHISIHSWFNSAMRKAFQHPLRQTECWTKAYPQALCPDGCPEKNFPQSRKNRICQYMILKKFYRPKERGFYP